MRFRSTNAKFVHYGGDILSNTDDNDCGVQLSGGSTSGLIAAISDNDDASLDLRAKGDGKVNIFGGGPMNITSSDVIGITADEITLTSTSVVLSSTEVFVGSSGAQVTVAGGAPFSGFIKFTDTAVATPNFATTNAMVMETTHTITGLAAQTLGGTTGWFVLPNPHNLSTDCALLHAWVGSTAGEVHCRFAKVSTLTVSASTATISFLVIRA